MGALTLTVVVSPVDHRVLRTAGRPANVVPATTGLEATRGAAGTAGRIDPPGEDFAVRRVRPAAALAEAGERERTVPVVKARPTRDPTVTGGTPVMFVIRAGREETMISVIPGAPAATRGPDSDFRRVVETAVTTERVVTGPLEAATMGPVLVPVQGRRRTGGQRTHDPGAKAVRRAVIVRRVSVPVQAWPMTTVLPRRRRGGKSATNGVTRGVARRAHVRAGSMTVAPVVPVMHRVGPEPGRSVRHAMDATVSPTTAPENGGGQRRRNAAAMTPPVRRSPLETHMLVVKVVKVVSSKVVTFERIAVASLARSARLPTGRAARRARTTVNLERNNAVTIEAKADRRRRAATNGPGLGGFPCRRPRDLHHRNKSAPGSRWGGPGSSRKRIRRNLPTIRLIPTRQYASVTARPSFPRP